MTYAIAKATRNALETECDAFSAILSASRKGPMNLTPDTIKATPEWKAAFTGYVKAFKALRAFNTRFVKVYAKEIQAERSAKLAAVMGNTP